MQELRTMNAVMSGAGSDSGFLSSGDSSVNGDYTSGSSSGKLNTTATTTPWGDKSIWGAPLSPTTTNNFNNSNSSNNFNNNSNNKEIWSDTSAGSLWDSSDIATNIKKSSSQEWLGSIWMIPQTPKAQNNICDAPNTYQTFKSEISGFQLMRPHDIGNNMWNNTAAAASMSGIKLPPNASTSSSSSNANRYNLKCMRINALAYGGGNQQQQQLQPPPPPPQYLQRATSLPQPALANNNNNNKFDMAQNACLQLFSDDFLNYFNTIH